MSEAKKRWLKINHDRDADKSFKPSIRKKWPAKRFPIPNAEPHTKVFEYYKNRKLYEPKGCGHTNLGYVIGCIEKGWKVQIIDKRTKEDLTYKILIRAYYFSWIRFQVKDLDSLFEKIKNFYSSLDQASKESLLFRNGEEA